MRRGSLKGAYITSLESHTLKTSSTVEFAKEFESIEVGSSQSPNRLLSDFDVLLL